MWELKKEELFEGYEWVRNGEVRLSRGSCGKCCICKYEDVGLVRGS